MNQFGVYGLLIMPHELDEDLFCGINFKASPDVLQLLGRMLQRCFAVKLQKCFVGYETFSHPE